MLENMEIETQVEQTVETKIAKKRGRPAKVDKEIFVEMWNKSANLDEVAALLNISKSSCSVRASNLRKAGSELRQFTRGRKPKSDSMVEVHQEITG